MIFRAAFSACMYCILAELKRLNESYSLIIYRVFKSRNFCFFAFAFLLLLLLCSSAQQIPGYAKLPVSLYFVLCGITISTSPQIYQTQSVSSQSLCCIYSLTVVRVRRLRWRRRKGKHEVIEF